MEHHEIRRLTERLSNTSRTGELDFETVTCSI